MLVDLDDGHERANTKRMWLVFRGMHVAVAVVVMLSIPAHASPPFSVQSPPKDVVGASEEDTWWLAMWRARLVAAPTAQRAAHVAVEIAGCAEANGYFRAAEHKIVLCHELWDARRSRWLRAGEPAEHVALRVRHAMTFTLAHELAHALLSAARVPIIGREEDATDELAALLLVASGSDGAAAAADAAIGHALRSKLRDKPESPLDEHSFGVQRAATIACVLVGAGERAAVERVATHLPLSQQFHDRCRSRFTERRNTWLRLLN